MPSQQQQQRRKPAITAGTVGAGKTSNAFSDSPFKVAMAIVAVSVVAMWLLSTTLGASSGAAASDASSGRHDISARRRQSIAVVPPDVAALVALVGHDDYADAGGSAFDQFRLSHPPQEAATILEQLATALFDINEAFEDEPAAVLAAQVDVQRLVKAVRALTTYAMCAPSSANGGGSSDGGSHAHRLPREGAVAAVACAGWLNPVVLPQHPSTALWSLAGAVAFAEGVALADYYRLLERDDLYSAALATAMEVLALSASPRGQQLLDYTAGVASGGGGQHSVLRLFVSSTMASPAHAARRRASMLEELIALNPEFGPLRLHYLAAILFDMDRAALPTSLELVNRELTHVDQRRHRDYRHTAVLHIMRLYATLLQPRSGGSGARDDDKGGDVVVLRDAANAFVLLLEAATTEAARGRRQVGCASLLLDPTSAEERAEWTAVVGTKSRPPLLLAREHALRLLQVVKSPLLPIMGAPGVEAVLGQFSKLCDE